MVFDKIGALDGMRYDATILKRMLRMIFGGVPLHGYTTCKGTSIICVEQPSTNS